jgi:hypothetical protein
MGFLWGDIMNHIYRIEEPVLFFGNNKPCLDPQVGLLNFGPFGGRGIDSEERISIRAGVIGTTRSIEATKTWLNRLKYRIIAVEKSNTEYKGIDFPGLSTEGPLKFDIVIDPNCVVNISRKFVVGLKKIQRKERVYNSALEYCNKIDDLSEAHPAPDIIFLPIDDDILRYCKEPGRKTDKIVYQQREFGDSDAINAPMFDFHNFIKAHSALRGFVTQLLLPKTLKFSEERQSPSIIGWNIAVGVYYKATGIPWKLADIDDKTCYVGVSFYNEIKTSRRIVRPSFAQVYMRTGESQIIRGQPFLWNFDEMGRLINLSSNQMEELISQSLEVYYNQRNELPQRIVIHKSTHFSDEEISGCERASEEIDELDIVHISSYTRFRAYHEKYDYPVVRGTVIANSDEAIMFSTGYVPALATYPGPTVPRPIHIKSQRIDTSLEMICKDIMSLTKLDWNSSTFYTKMPVTLSVSKKVGAVMAEMDTDNVEPPSSYRYYM